MEEAGTLDVARRRIDLVVVVVAVEVTLHVVDVFGAWVSDDVPWPSLSW